MCPGFFVSGALRTATERLHCGVDFVEVDSDDASVYPVARYRTLGYPFSNGAQGHAHVFGALLH